MRLYLGQVESLSQYGRISPPLGLLYLAAYLRERFPLDIAVAHQGVERCSSEQFAKMLIRFEPDIIGLRVLTPAAHTLSAVTQAIRAALPRSLILLGGPHVSAFGEDALAGTAADLAVAEEGELMAAQILEAYRGNGTYEDIPGLIRRTSSGEIVTNPGQPPMITDLDTLPFPAYDLLNIKPYWRRSSMPPIPYRKYISLFSSRGCPYGCSYCHNIFGRRFRMHSPERMVEEVKHYVKQYGVNEIEFLDDCFNLNKKRVLQYAEGLQREVGPIKTAFPNAIRGDILDEEMFEALAEAGMYYTSLALESGSPRIQELIGKRLDIPKYLRAVELCARRRVFTNGFVMLGFPTETEAEIQETIRVASESQLHIASFFTVTPFPNTDLYRQVQRYAPEKLSSQRYSDMAYWSVRINLTDIPDAAFFAYQREAFRKFYLRPDRLYRLARAYPKPHLLPAYIPMFLLRALKGLW